MCAAVRYRVTGPLRDVVGCHCSQCRRMTSHFMAATAARLADFALLADTTLRWYAASAEARRGFCAACGSTLFWAGNDRDYLSIAAGTLDDARKPRLYRRESTIPTPPCGRAVHDAVDV